MIYTQGVGLDKQGKSRFIYDLYSRGELLDNRRNKGLCLDKRNQGVIKDLYSRGGLLDKPGKSRDFYHTCYTLRKIKYKN